jgi:phage gp36-like protein
VAHANTRYEGRLCQSVVVAEVKHRLENAVTQLRQMSMGFEAVGMKDTATKLSNIIGKLLDQKEDLYYLHCELQRDLQENKP